MKRPVRPTKNKNPVAAALAFHKEFRQQIVQDGRPNKAKRIRKPKPQDLPEE
jgi:hypothetical protein